MKIDALAALEVKRRELMESRNLTLQLLHTIDKARASFDMAWLTKDKCVCPDIPCLPCTEYKHAHDILEKVELSTLRNLLNETTQ